MTTADEGREDLKDQSKEDKLIPLDEIIEYLYNLIKKWWKK